MKQFIKDRIARAEYLISNKIKPVAVQGTRITKGYLMLNKEGRRFWTLPETALQTALLKLIAEGKIKLTPGFIEDIGI